MRLAFKHIQNELPTEWTQNDLPTSTRIVSFASRWHPLPLESIQMQIVQKGNENVSPFV